MSRHRWSDRNESLNALSTAIQQSTHGRIRDLSLELANQHCAVVRGNSSSYYGVQLVIHTLKRFCDENRVFSETRLLLSVDGHPLELSIAHSSNAFAREPVSTHDADRHLELTIAATARQGIQYESPGLV